MKTKIWLLFSMTAISVSCYAQNWLITGNSGITTSDFIGVTNNADLIFKTNNIEGGRLLKTSVWQFGTTTNFAKIDPTGKLTFGGTGTYQVAGNKYAFQYTGDPDYGLFFNSTNVRYEFRNGSAVPVFYVDANNGNSVFNGTLKVGAYTLPSIDGVNGQVLKTNGAGVLTWSNDNNSVGSGANTSLSNLTATAVNQSLLAATTNAIDLGSSSKTWRNIYLGDKLYLGLNIVLHSPSSSFGNFFLGMGAGNTSLIGNYNTGTGQGALGDLTSGEDNTANGYTALFFNTTGNYNTATGSRALYVNLTGSYNTATGEEALFSNSTGVYNSAHGYLSLSHNTGGYNNTASGVNALFSNTDGSGNTADGVNALYTNITGGGNTALGLQADVSAGNLSYATVIGAGAIVDASYKVRIGSTSIGSIGGQVGWTIFSDGRYKKNIKENVPGLSFINSLRPVTYTVDIQGLNEYYDKGRKQVTENEDENSAEKAKAADRSSKIVYDGFIAQEVEEAAKKLNFEFSGVDKPQNKDGVYGLRYDNFVVPLVKAVQELSKENDELRARLDRLEALLTQQSSQGVELSDKAMLEQNIPNPAKGITTIRYIVQSYIKSAYINVYSSSNALIRSIKIASKGSGSVELKLSELSSGVYQYALIVDGKVIDRKQMIITK